jgi:hypothetical protein
LPIDAGHKDAGEIVDPGWESRSGHSIAALRYGCMSRPGATDDDPEAEVLDDPRAEALRQTYVRERELSEETEFEQYEDSLYGGWP